MEDVRVAIEKTMGRKDLLRRVLEENRPIRLNSGTL
jgi:hypothetical protein